MAEHTKTPWHIENEETIKIKDAKGDSVASMFHFHLRGRRPTNEVEANAAFIVKAVNSHEALVKALEMFVNRMVEYGNWDDGCFYYNRISASELQKPIDLAKAALKAIEVQP